MLLQNVWNSELNELYKEKTYKKWNKLKWILQMINTPLLI